MSAAASSVIDVIDMSGLVADERLAHLEAIGRTGAMNALNVIAQQAAMIAEQRKEIARLASEVEGLKRHIVQMGRAE